MIEFARSCAVDDVISSAVRITLLCPLTRMRIGTPARSERCRHVECFDLDAYLQCQRSSRTPKWQCPICSADARPRRLRICAWFESALTQPCDEREVQLNADGSHACVAREEMPARKRKFPIPVEGEESKPVPQNSAGDEEDNPICLD
uniref:SP-RING-type domain-containing protein n=1 Tax=Coccolithus braarudii TaxID=221442 RepID=A0A7S0L034_9EUKA|mmetsp:Transcript_1029/g.2104  ORF Transcript_1029/g.2104 Transcript_1029/m.2104 type:complete len:148 (+) Transcript_1029:3-446(+)